MSDNLRMIDARDISNVETRPHAGDDPAMVAEWPEDDAPRSFGRYVALEGVGRGGMGRVLRAYDPVLQREVALKLLRTEVLGAEAQERLVREARAMAKLSHPNVVAVHDVLDTPAGVTLVMELVPGQTLRSWLRDGPRPWREIVARFLEAGRGLAAAHAEGLLHRDFKPSNVLVPPRGPAKVTDFGLAKLVTGADSLRSSESSGPSAASSSSFDVRLTEAGTVIGTPLYMAPEQHCDWEIGPAVDQYAFCVALWEALTGEPPFRGDWHELAAQKVRGAPPWPSRVAVPASLVAALRRGLAVEAYDRWPSLSALLDALSPAPRRSPWAWPAAAVVTLGLGAMGWPAWHPDATAPCSGAEEQLVGAWDAERRGAVAAALTAVPTEYAAQASTRAAEVLDRYADDWKAMRVEACEATTVRGEQSAALMDRRMACLHRARVALQAVTGVLADADAQVVQNVDPLLGGLPPLSRCADLEALQADVEPPPPEQAEPVEQARARLAEATALHEAGRYAAAKAEVALAKERLAPVDYGPAQAEVAYVEGLVLAGLGEHTPAEQSLRSALGLALRWRQWPLAQSIAVRLINVIGFEQKRAAEALHYRELAEGLAMDDPHRLGSTLSAVANTLNAKGDYAQAEVEHRRALALHERVAGPESLVVATTHNNLAVVLQEQGKHAEAEAEIRRALELRERGLGPDHPLVAMSLSNLAGFLQTQGKHAEAEALQRTALARRERALGPKHPHVGMSRINLAACLRAQGRHVEAEPELRGALAIFEASLGPAHPHVGAARLNLANLLKDRGELAQAEVELVRAVEILDGALGPEHPHTVKAREGLEGVRRAQAPDAAPGAGEASKAADAPR